MIAIGAALKTFIYLISACLLYPVLLLLVVLTVVVIVAAGAFFAEWLERCRLKKCPPQDLPEILCNGSPRNMVSHRVLRYLNTLEKALRQPENVEFTVENLLQQTCLDLSKSLDRLQMAVRIGPSLGLIGTIIPMGTGLAALSRGDMTQLSTDLVIAFTTTVTGLAVGTAAFFFYTIRRRWIEEDIKNMELATDLRVLQWKEKDNGIHGPTADEKVA